MVRGTLVAAVVCTFACAAAYDRAGWVLQSHGGLLLSNEPLLRERPLPERVGDSLEVSYPVLLENQGPELARVYLSQARARVGDTEGTAENSCAVLHGVPGGDFSLIPGRRTRVDCRVRLTSLGVQRLAQGDAPLVLAIPAALGDDVLALGVTYRLYEGEAP